MFRRERLRMQFIPRWGFILNSCHEGAKASLCSGIVLKNSDTSGPEISYIQIRDGFSFDCYYVGNMGQKTGLRQPRRGEELK